MGKKRCRSKYVSKGQRSNVSSKNKFDTWSILDRELFKFAAKAARKRTCQTIPNPDVTNTKERYIKVCMNG